MGYSRLSSAKIKKYVIQWSSLTGESLTSMEEQRKYRMNLNHKELHNRSQETDVDSPMTTNSFVTFNHLKNPSPLDIPNTHLPNSRTTQLIQQTCAKQKSSISKSAAANGKPYTFVKLSTSLAKV
jgi:hypothetical protein